MNMAQIFSILEMYASQNRWHELYAELRANFKEQMQKNRYFCLKILKLWIWFTYLGLYILKRKLKSKC